MEEGEVNGNVVDYILELKGRLKKCQDLATERISGRQLKRNNGTTEMQFQENLKWDTWCWFWLP